MQGEKAVVGPFAWHTGLMYGGSGSHSKKKQWDKNVEHVLCQPGSLYSVGSQEGFSLTGLKQRHGCGLW